MEIRCAYCEEEILPHERMNATGGDGSDGQAHRECWLRMIAGSVAHQTGKCSCRGGAGEDDPALTTRENARRAARYFMSGQDKAAKAKFN